MKKLVWPHYLQPSPPAPLLLIKSISVSQQPTRHSNRWMPAIKLLVLTSTASALCKQMQADCTFTNHAFDSLIPALKFKKYDAVISGMDITPERSKQVSFTQPYYANSALVIAKKTPIKPLLI